MFEKILIANRGEIAVRIIRTCREMNIRTVAVYSEADREALHTILADESICIGSAASKDSYLNMPNILNAAILTGANAIHPGFGFLSENSQFAQMCKECNIKFIGPDSHSIDMLGNKAVAKKTMMDNGVPTIPGSDGALENEEQALALAEEMGYPVLLKASAGGGGRGIRIVENASGLSSAYFEAKAEADACFGDDELYLEKFLTHTRHIEFQILGDNFGNVVHLGERDCSLQRRKQKVLEEAPSVALTPHLRKEMGDAAVRAAKAVGYKNTGTVEFLLDRNSKFYFMEMNTRIQVEHPVTEMITGLDLIKEQILIAVGEKLSFAQKDIKQNGCSIECRINAESPKNNFRPTGGTVEYLHIPGGLGVRFDSALYQGYKIPPHYDSMLGKMIVHANTRDEAIARMKSALHELSVEGVETNIEFQMEILNNPEFIAGQVDTSFIDEKLVI